MERVGSIAAEWWDREESAWDQVALEVEVELKLEVEARRMVAADTQ